MFVFLFSANSAFAQTCGDTSTPGNETGRCLSKCDPATEHEISDGGSCIGQDCCARNPAGSTTTSGTTMTPFEKCIEDGGDYDDCKTYPGAPAVTGTSGGNGGGTGSGATGGATGGGAGLPMAPGSSSTTATGGWSLGNISGFGLPAGSVWGIITNILVWMLGLFGIIGIIGFLISGIIYLTAAGDEDRMAYAKRAMQYSIIGVIVGLVGFVVIQAINYALNTYSSF